MSAPLTTVRPTGIRQDTESLARTPPAMERKLVAILSADVKGYSRLMGEDELATVRILAVYRDELMTTLVQQHGGKVVGAPGDNLLALFTSVVEAVQCAVEIQHALRVKNAELPASRRMEFRIGINLGDVLIQGAQIHGEGINIAARLEGLAEGGGICISGVVYEQIKHKMALRVEDVGEHTLKNIAEPVRVYRVQIELKAEGEISRGSQEQLLLFSPFHLDVVNACLWRGKKRISLTPKDFAVLHHLAVHPQQLVTHEELLKAVWSDVKVSPGVLKVCLRRIRQALGDSSTKPHFIETKHRQGYRFIAPIAASPQPVSSSKFEVSGLESEPVPSPQPPAPNFVGRGAELRQLERWLEKALRGERRLVFVTGEPGIGKTTVVNACLERVTVQGRIAIGRGQCIEHYGPGEAYLPVLEALGRLCREPGGSRLIDWLRQHAPTWLVQMPAFLNATDLEALQRKIQGTTRERMLREMLEAVEVLTEQQPLVLVLEDLHWSDVSTLELLAAAARRQERARMLIIGTYRPVEMLSKEHPLNEVMQELYAHNLCAELALELLSEADVAEYLCTRFPVNALPADLARALHQRTEGNPLFLVNVVDDLVAQEVIAQGEEGWTLQGGIQAIEGQVPESIRHLITKQSKRLLPVEQRILQAASVAGIEFSAAAVAAALEADEAEVEEWCAGLAARQHFLRRTGISQWPDGTVAEHYGFLHALYQHLWHERVGMGRRRQLHLRIGERQEAAYGDRTGEIAAELAVHFEQGRDYPRAVRYRAQAAEQAVQRYAHQEAVAHLTKSLELLNTLPETPERTQQELALRTTLGITLQANRGYGNPVVEQAYARARELSQKVREPAQLFRVLFGLFQLHVTRAEYQTAHELGRQIIDLAQSAREPALLVEAHGAVGIVLFFLGELAASRTQFERSMVLYNPSQHRTHAVTYGQDPWVACRSSSAEVLWLLGYPAQALQKANESVTFAQELSHPFSLAFALYSAALVSQFRRDVSAVQQQAEVLLTLAREQGFPLWELGATNLQGWALAEQGQGTEGITLIRQSSSARRATSTALRMPYHQARLAEAHGKARQTEEGLTLLEKALMTAANTGEFWWKAELYRLKGELLLQSRQVQASPEQVQTSPGKSLVPSPHPPSSNTRAEAEKCFRQAVDLARRQSAKSLELRAVMSLSRLWQQQGKKDEARRMLAEIYGWFTEGFDTADLREAKALLAALA